MAMQGSAAVVAVAFLAGAIFGLSVDTPLAPPPVVNFPVPAVPNGSQYYTAKPAPLRWPLASCTCRVTPLDGGAGVRR